MSRLRPLIPLAIILCGLLCAQAVGYVHIRQSNARLLAKTQALAAAGYLAVPNAHIQPLLKEPKTAAAGGLFFTLTLGAGLTMAALGAGLAWGLVARFGRWFPAFLCLGWAGLMAALLAEGLPAIELAYLAVTPPLVFGLGGLWARLARPRRPLFAALAFALPVLILAGCWATQYDKQMFVNMRDFLLLNNPVGRAVNEFYYAYTLYPAETFKALGDKQMRIVAVEAQGPQGDRLSAALTQADWLPVKGFDRPEAVFTLRGQELGLASGGKTLLRLPLEDFLARPRPSLDELSQKADHYALFRRLVFYGLLFGFPTAIYALLFSSFLFLTGLALGDRAALALAGAACLALGLVMLIPLASASRVSVSPATLGQALASGQPAQEVAALRLAGEKRLDITRTPGYQALKNSPSTATRYWLALALGARPNPLALEELIALTRDKSPDVSRMALASIGRTGRAELRPLVREHLENSKDWYVQWYAYYSLKRLGFSQAASG